MTSGTMFCPGGTGSVACVTSADLAPNDSVVLLFRLVAAPTSPGGEITATVANGTTINVRLTVKIAINPHEHRLLQVRGGRASGAG